MRRIYFADGRKQDIAQRMSFEKLKEMAGIPYAEALPIRVNGTPHFLLVDEDGLQKKLSLNDGATKIYQSCWASMKHPIVGNAVVIPNDELE